jgi:hypothetical protein
LLKDKRFKKNFKAKFEEKYNVLILPAASYVGKDPNRGAIRGGR